MKPQPPWMTAKIRQAIKSKHSAWRAFKLNPSAATKSVFVSLRNQVTSCLRSAVRSYLTTLHRDIRLTNSLTSVKRFWRRLKSLSGRIQSSAIPDLQVFSAPGDPVHVVSTDWEKADILNEFFALRHVWSTAHHLFLSYLVKFPLSQSSPTCTQLLRMSSTC